MKTKPELIKEFAPYGSLRGGEFYLPYPKALEFIDECAKNELANLGIEGFTHTPSDNGLIAHLDMIADFSEEKPKYPEWSEWVEYCRQASHAFMQTLAHEGKAMEKHLFNFVPVSEERWEELG